MTIRTQLTSGCTRGEHATLKGQFCVHIVYVNSVSYTWTQLVPRKPTVAAVGAAMQHVATCFTTTLSMVWSDSHLNFLSFQVLRDLHFVAMQGGEIIDE